MSACHRYACAAAWPMLLAATLAFAACRRAPAPAWLTATADRGPVQEAITATGQVDARTRVNVGSEISGTLRRVCVDYGAVVRRGQLLAELEPRGPAAQLARAEASVQVAQAALVQARVDGHDRARAHARTQQLRAAHLVADTDLEAAEVARDRSAAGVAGAEAALVQARAEAALARATLAMTRIESPIDGVVLERRADAGQTVAAQLQVATLFVIAADMARVQLVVSVDEADVGKLVPPLRATFRVPAYPRRTFAGTLTALRPAPEGGEPSAAGSNGGGSSSGSAAAAGGVVTYGAVVAADNPDGALRQGMTAELSAVVAERQDAVRVPGAALRYRPRDAAPAPAAADDGAQSTLYVLEGGRPVARAVRLGPSDGQYVAVDAGLAAGEVLVLGAAPDAGGGRATRR